MTTFLAAATIPLTDFAESEAPFFVPAPASPIPVQGGPGNVAISDLNADGNADLVVATGQRRSITVLLGQGSGRFNLAPGGPLPLPDSPGEMAPGDVNTDGIPDLAIASHDTYSVMLLLGNAESGFALARSSSILMKEGQHPHTHGLALGDLNADGHLDLVTVNSEDNDLSLALGDGRGKFVRAPGSPFPVGKSPYPLALGDLNADGRLDIVATSTATAGRALSVLINDARGSFQRRDVALRTSRPWFVAIGDIDRDGKPDLVASHAEQRPLTVLLGDGRGGFAEADGSPFDLGHSAWHVGLLDVNRDGQADVVAAADNALRVLLGDGHGKFKPAPGPPVTAGKGAWRMAIGDLNRDGKPDVATSNLESDSVSILLAR